jgi:hypothetical protein
MIAIAEMLNQLSILPRLVEGTLIFGGHDAYREPVVEKMGLRC